MLTEEEKKQIRESASTGKAVQESKLFEPVYKLITGMPVFAAIGLEDRMHVDKVSFYALLGKGVEGIQEEVNQFAASDLEDQDKQQVKELLNYILFEPTAERNYENGIRDKGRGKMQLSDFLNNPKVQTAKLDVAEVVAMRLYTTAAYKHMNQPLRDVERYNTGKPCPLPVTTYFAVAGIRKLRALDVSSVGPTILWRGMRNIEVAENFMLEGGTELAFMSTTTDLSVAVHYSLSEHSLLFKLVSPNFMTIGADLHWLSAFPGEREVLYPPLTYLKPTGRTEVITIPVKGKEYSFTVVEVHPTLS